jgi:HlyD family secretion protein
MPYSDSALEIKSDEIQEIIGKAPSSIVRWGISVIAACIIVLLIGASYFQYPEIISAPVVISSAKPAVKLVAQTTGRISELRIKDADLVSANEIVAIIENPANTTDVLYLRDIINMLDTCMNVGHLMEKMHLRKNMQVGDLQGDYASLYQAMSQYIFLVNNSYYQNKINSLEKQIASSNKLKSSMEERTQLQKGILKLETIKDSANRLLKDVKVIAPLEYNESLKGLLSQQLSVAESKSSLFQNDLQKTEYGKSISDIEQQYRTEENISLSNIKELVKKLKGSIASWEKLYVLCSPIAGCVTCFNVWNVNQYISANATAFMIVPKSDTALEIRVKLPQIKAGKIQVGQSARIKLQEYPFEEYGMLKAQVVSISPVSMDGSYLVRLALVSGLTTTLNKQIPSSAEITGVADIVTENKSVMKRVLEKAYGKMN